MTKGVGPERDSSHGKTALAHLRARQESAVLSERLLRWIVQFHSPCNLVRTMFNAARMQQTGRTPSKASVYCQGIKAGATPAFSLSYGWRDAQKNGPRSRKNRAKSQRTP
jgi:hypothetical protein